jgi:hypothetical protein
MGPTSSGPAAPFTNWQLPEQPLALYIDPEYARAAQGTSVSHLMNIDNEIFG